MGVGNMTSFLLLPWRITYRRGVSDEDGTLFHTKAIPVRFS